MGTKNYKTLIGLLSIAVMVISCKKDKPSATINTVPPGTSGNVYVACQGLYQTGRGSLYDYNYTANKTYGDLYKAANNSYVGDVFQSMVRIGSNFFLVANNSDIIDVVDATTYKLITTISVPQPRYILPVSSNKAYISSYNNNKIYVVNTATYALMDTIAIANNSTEGMCLYDNYAVICPWDTAGNQVYLVDYSNNEVVKSIRVAGYAPSAALVDKDHMLWVMAGNQYSGKTASLTRVDPTSGDILASYMFDDSANLMNLVCNNAGDTLYFIESNQYGGTSDNGVYRMSIYAEAQPAQPLILPQPQHYFYALGIDPSNGNIFVADPVPFGQQGSLYIYHPDGSIANSFVHTLGVGPGFFYFDY